MIAIFFAFVTLLATFAGGLLPFSKPFQKIQLRYLIAFAGGAMLAIAFFDLIPQASESKGALFFVAVGFFLLYLIEKLIMIHSCHESECESHEISGPVAMVGIIAESLADGIAIAVGFAVSPALGFIIALAVFFHEFPRGFSTTVIMKAAKLDKKAIILALLIDGGFTVIGALIGVFFPQELFPYIIAFTAGTFLYIGASDMLPEAHKRFNILVVGSVFLGAGLLLLVSLVAKI